MSAMNRIAFLCGCTTAVLAGLAGSVGAAPPAKLPPQDLPVPEAAFHETQRHWFGVYLNGNKSGWGSESRAPGQIDGKPCVTSAMEMTMEMTALGNTLRMEFATRTHFAMEPPHRALAIEETRKMDGQERRLVLRHRDGTGYTAEITEAGKTRREDVGDIDLRLSHETSPEVWAADAQRKPGDAIGTVEFSSDNMGMTQQTVTVLREADWAGPGGKLPVWELDLYDHEAKFNIVARISRSDGSIVNAHFGQLIEVRMEPEKVAKQMPDGSPPDFFLAMTISADRKLGKSTKLSELVIELVPPDGGKAPDLPDTVNQSVEKDGNGRLTVRLGAGAGQPQPASAEERAEFLKSTPRYPVNEESVKQLARKAVAGAAGDRDKVERLLKFTDRYITDSYELEALTVMDLMRTRKGDCSAHALLFTTLARATGIPAREAGGWMYMGDEYRAFGGHAWNEVVLDGHWVPVDPIWAQMQLDAGHIQQHAGDPDGTAIEGMMTGLKAKVISFKRN
jgi:Transglutaminase-like superfamily